MSPDPFHTSPSADDHRPTEWAVSDGLIDYRAAEQAMRLRAEAIAAGQAPELVWLLEHPPLYTAGTSARAEDLIAPERFPVYETGRGGQFTYHGPGQRVAYVMLNLKARKPDVRAFVAALERWLIASLGRFNVEAFSRSGRVGLWVPRPGHQGLEDKIAAIGIRLHKWVSYHGVSLNVGPDLEHFSGIVPCGIAQHGVTSLEALGHPVSLPEVDIALRAAFEREFGPVQRAAAPLA